MFGPVNGFVIFISKNYKNLMSYTYWRVRLKFGLHATFSIGDPLQTHAMNFPVFVKVANLVM